MQKGIIIFFAVFYAWASIGISVNAHYCLGQLESIEVFADIRSCCCGELEDKTGCCNDEHIQMQLDQAQQSVQSFRLILPDFSEIAQADFSPDESLLGPSREVCVEWLDLPPPPLQPKWLLHCSLTYYG